MKKVYFTVGLLFLVFFFSQNLVAQNCDGLKAQIIKDWGRAKAYTKTLLDAMPAAHYNYSPADTGHVRSFSGQMLHLAQGNIFFISTVSGKEINFNFPKLENLTTAEEKDSVIYCVLASYDVCLTALREIDASRFWEITTNEGHSVSRFEWISVGFEHQTHQRALCALYTRLVGIKPPEEMLF
jgi:uncharacterized damage-inducible protein DinB